MTAKNRFDDTMNRCSALVVLATREGNDDCLRMAMVLAVSAMEKYVKDRFRESFARFFRQSHGLLNDDLARLLNDAGVDAAFWNEMVIQRHDRPLRSMRNRLAKYLETFAIQSAASINRLYICYGLKNITAHVMRRAGLKTMSSSMKRMIDRRHAIAHGSDISVSGRLQPITSEEVTLRLDRLTRFVTAMDEIVTAKFSSRRRNRHAMKKHSQISTKKTIH